MTACKTVYPPPLREGDTVGIIAPAGPVNQNLLNQGIAELEKLGLKTVLGKSVAAESGYLAGCDEIRQSDVNSMFKNPNIHALFAARGGYGCMRMLECLDYKSVRLNPKIVLGMSDITALQSALFKKSGLVTLAGPMVAGCIGNGLDHISSESLHHFLFRPISHNYIFASATEGKVLAPGRAVGNLLGGCLSLICALLGSKYSCSFKNAILFIEDVNEPLYRIDRMLMQLHLAGVFKKISGLILGRFLDSSGNILDNEVESILFSIITRPGFPIISRIPHGHSLPNLTFPHGAHVELNTDDKSLRVAVDGP
jgi:muramoyltetrapeptide carboxypeptidase